MVIPFANFGGNRHGDSLRWQAKLGMRPGHGQGIGLAMQEVIASHVPVGLGDVVASTPLLASGRVRPG